MLNPNVERSLCGGPSMDRMSAALRRSVKWVGLKSATVLVLSIGLRKRPQLGAAADAAGFSRCHTDWRVVATLMTERLI